MPSHDMDTSSSASSSLSTTARMLRLFPPGAPRTVLTTRVLTLDAFSRRLDDLLGPRCTISAVDDEFDTTLFPMVLLLAAPTSFWSFDGRRARPFTTVALVLRDTAFRMTLVFCTLA